MTKAEDLKVLKSGNVQDEAPENFDASQLSGHERKIYDLVDEMVTLFRPRIESGELTPYEVVEAMGITLTGTIISIVPEAHLKQVEREAESLYNYVLKNFDGRVHKRNYTFVSQLLGATRFASSVVNHGSAMIRQYKEQAEQMAAAKVQEATDALDKLTEDEA